MKQTREEQRELAHRQLAEHELEVVQESGPVRAWYLKRPGTRMGCVLILAHPEGVTICGDLAPNNNEGATARKPLGWFAGDGLSPSYLAEKFLPRVWCPDIAEEHVRMLLEESTPPGEDSDARLSEETREALADALRYAHCEQQGSYTQYVGQVLYEEEGMEAEDAWPDHDYSARDEALLHAIQRRFRELFWQRYERFTDDGQLVPRGVPAGDKMAFRVVLVMPMESVTMHPPHLDQGVYVTSKCCEEGLAADGVVVLDVSVHGTEDAESAEDAIRRACEHWWPGSQVVHVQQARRVN